MLLCVNNNLNTNKDEWKQDSYLFWVCKISLIPKFES